MRRRTYLEARGLDDMARRVKSKPLNLAWLRAAMDQKGITQRELAKKLNSNPTSVNHKLNGRQSWQIEELTQVAAFLGVSLAELMRGMGYKQPADGGNKIVGRIAGASQVSTITDRLGDTHTDLVSSDEEVLLVDDPSNDMLSVVNGGAVYFLPIDIGPALNTLAVIEAPGMIVPVVGTLSARDGGGYSIQPLACKQAPVEVERVYRVQPVTRLVLPPRRLAAPRK